MVITFSSQKKRFTFFCLCRGVIYFSTSMKSFFGSYATHGICSCLYLRCCAGLERICPLHTLDVLQRKTESVFPRSLSDVPGLLHFLQSSQNVLITEIYREILKHNLFIWYVLSGRVDIVQLNYKVVYFEKLNLTLRSQIY